MHPSLTKNFLPAVLAAWLLAGCGGGGGGGSPPVTTQPPPVIGNYTDPTLYSSAANAQLTSPNENVAVTHAQVTVGGTVLGYTATVGHMTALALGSNAPQASFFYVAYTLDGAAPGTRPVTFFYNGGPGSASVWLHLGSFGPKRLDTGEPNMSGSPPFPLVDNAESMLDLSDLVFVDAIGSGYSQAIAPNTNGTFWGVDADGAVFRDFVMRYVAVNNRASSPKFLYGESYGGPRTAVLADLLESAGVHLAGIVLQSPALDYNNNCGIVTGRVSCSSYLPSYGAIGAWFSLTDPPHPPAQLAAFMQEMRAMSEEFEPVVQAFFNSNAQPDPLFLTRLAANTGLARTHWQANVNIGPEYYRTHLTPGTLHGRYDGRVTLPNNSLPGREIDPSDVLISPSFSFRIGEYLATGLGYTTPATYTMLSNAIASWNFTHDGHELPDTVPDIASAIAQNPRLRVLSVNGYHDLATPFRTTERDLARLGNNPNVAVREYIGGHMTYLENASRRAMKADLADFYRSALAN
jgi:carboxypeptidase C (cathepsin A)